MRVWLLQRGFERLPQQSRDVQIKSIAKLPMSTLLSFDKYTPSGERVASQQSKFHIRHADAPDPLYFYCDEDLDEKHKIFCRELEDEVVVHNLACMGLENDVQAQRQVHLLDANRVGDFLAHGVQRLSLLSSRLRPLTEKSLILM